MNNEFLQNYVSLLNRLMHCFDTASAMSHEEYKKYKCNICNFCNSKNNSCKCSVIYIFFDNDKVVYIGSSLDSATRVDQQYRKNHEDTGCIYNTIRSNNTEQLTTKQIEVKIRNFKVKILKSPEIQVFYMFFEPLLITLFQPEYNDEYKNYLDVKNGIKIHDVIKSNARLFS